jgi:hypothetical protein
MFLLAGDGKFYDVLERVLYNGLISGSGLSGDRFFYPNPLASYGQHQRDPWFPCACCPSNLSRFIPSLPGYLYATRDNSIYVNLFVQSEADIELGEQTVHLRQTTDYPWEGIIVIDVEPERPDSFAIHVRIPGWARNKPIPGDLYSYMEPSDETITLAVNGEEWPLELEKGFVRIERPWEKGDQIELILPMHVRRVVSHPNVVANMGKLALERGPLVYCIEWPDHGGYVSNVILPADAELDLERRDDLADGVTVFKGKAVSLHETEPRRREIELTAIPYYAWAYRGNGEMAVWISKDEEGVRPVPKPTLASQSEVSSSGGKVLTGLNDQWDPANSKDRSRPYLHYWPSAGTVEWVQYDFPKITTVSRVGVYWYDDTGRGNVRVPASWKVLFRKGDHWVPVVPKDSFGVAADGYNWTAFETVETTGLRLEMQSQDEFSVGIIEWKVE